MAGGRSVAEAIGVTALVESRTVRSPTRRFAGILLGSVIAAAFLGPGTVTTAAKAGAAHGVRLLWTLVFATVACAVLQEASARLTVVSGHTLGAAMAARRGGAGWRWAVLTAVFLGCAAYEAGNVLGGVAGAELAVDAPRAWLTVASVLAAGLLLGFGGTRGVVAVLSALVAVMGGAFLVTAWTLRPPWDELLAGLIVPRLPSSGLLVLGLIGTTVVPYNLFLGSGLARGRRLGEMRLGLAISIGLGGLISMGVLVVGTAVSGELTFAKLAAALGTHLGGRADLLFAIGLFAAGFSSAVTAPLAAALTARSLLAEGPDDPRWSDASPRFRGVWLAVLGIGALFGLLEVKPIPAIVLAQALNGLLLPVVAVFLLLAVNDRRLVGDHVNGLWSNAWSLAVVAVTVLLGVRFLAGAASGIGITVPDEAILGLAGAVVVVGAMPLVKILRRLRSGS